MAQVFDFTTGLSTDSLLERFEGFHDWILESLLISGCRDDIEADPAMKIDYDLSLKLKDKYERFEISEILLEFYNVDKVN